MSYAEVFESIDMESHRIFPLPMYERDNLFL
jgi:hypothetical protein